MTTSPTPGYSGTPLAKQLGITIGTRLLLVSPPPEYPGILGKLPQNATVGSRTSALVDVAHLFATRRSELARQLKRLRGALRPDAAIWVSWPKKAAKVPTDITENEIRNVALPLGFVDVKVCAVTEVWSGLKLVVRKELR